ncbi:ABC transporter permease [Actinomadura alba]|uniref:ABC transporter permease n=1 Tax=Actinomadura alba TaxID=406431 RepID=A0ABR7LS01_9ACTN|nr:ABC transporter permease [Actinomadura alba]MBC6467614.1 ABC transporter permease [Actinomadura alba]
MLRFLLHRMLFALLVMWLVATSVFVLLRLSPGPVERVIAGPRASAETLAQIHHNLGLDQPVLTQYGAFLGGLAHGDLGYSYVNGTAVTALIGDRLPTTLCLVLGAAVLCFAGGVATGVLSAIRPHGRFDRISTGLVLVGLSTPSFLLALVLLQVFVGRAGELGLTFFEAGPPLQENFLRRMILPWVGLAFLMVAAYTRLTRGSMLEVLGADYVRTARAKGLPERRVTCAHALRSALSPVVAQFGVDVGVLIGSTIVTEQVFGLQGIGQLVYHSISVGDTPVIIGVTMLASLCVVAANLAVDVVHSFLDPRLRPD